MLHFSCLLNQFIKKIKEQIKPRRGYERSHKVPKTAHMEPHRICLRGEAVTKTKQQQQQTINTLL
jgi:hypothetical protein